MAETILLTGASGVLGSELAKRYPAGRLILTRHRTPLDHPAKQVSIDIRTPQLGLSDEDYAALASETDIIIHAAAITDMGGAAPGLEETNIDGVRHVAEFAKAADAPLHYISTAYCSLEYASVREVSSAYVESKRNAEDVVMQSGAPYTILRPSIISGHSETGEIASFQGFHLFIRQILMGRSPIIPLERGAHCDFIPVDLVARSVAEAVSAPEFGRTYWLTGGADALTIGDMFEVGRPFAEKMGRDLDQVKLVSPEEMTEICEALPRRLKERALTMMELSNVMARAELFPSDVNALLGQGALSKPVLAQTLSSNLEWWGRGKPIRNRL